MDAQERLRAPGSGASIPSIDALLAWPDAMLPRVSTLLALRRLWQTELYGRLFGEYEAAVAGGPEPATSEAAEPLIQGLPTARYLQWLHRYIQDENWRLCREVVVDRLDAIEAVLEPREGDLGTLETVPDLAYPGYYSFDFHRQDGGIWRDAAGAAVYALGARIVHTGRNSAFQLHDQFAAAIPAWSEERGPARILDLGCGFGKTTFSLKQRWGQAEVIGLDLSAPCLKLGRRMATERGLEISWRQGDMEMLPFADSSIDLATATMVLHELPPQAIAVSLAEAARVLKPGGLLVMLENRFLGDPFRDTLLRWYSAIIDEPYSTPFRQLDLTELGRKAGFAEVEVRKWYMAAAGGPEAEADRGRWLTPWALTVARKR